MATNLSSHPWANHLNIRKHFNITCNFEENYREPAPQKFNHNRYILSPDDGRALTVRECITLEDVVDFRDETSRLKGIEENDTATHLENLSLEAKGCRVLYRFIDIFNGNQTLAILEAIHFELFMPDRPDLRFIAIPKQSVSPDVCEGDFFEIESVKYTPKVSKMHCGIDYSVSWTVTQCNQMESQANPVVDYIYVVEKCRTVKEQQGSKDRKVVTNWSPKYLRVRHHRFKNSKTEKTMRLHQIYEASLTDTSSAWIYPVEPPKNREEYARLVGNIRSTSSYPGTFADEIIPLSPSEQARIDDRLGDFNEFSKNMRMAEQHMIRLFKLGARFRQLEVSPQQESIFLYSFDPPKFQVYSEIFHIDAVTLLFEEEKIRISVHSIKREMEGKRKVSFIQLQDSPDLLRICESKSVDFWMEATFHGREHSATEKILDEIENEIAIVEETGEVKPNFLIEAEIPNILQAVYGNAIEEIPVSAVRCCIVQKANGQQLRLNEQQTHAMNLYHTIENSGYCILSPPGSGKTTVAAAMAATLLKDAQANRNGSVQLLLAVQNAAVENLAVALKSFDDATIKSYRMLSKVRTDQNESTPYAIFDHFADYRRWMKDAPRKDLLVMDKFFENEAKLRNAEMSGLDDNRAEIEALNNLYTNSLLKAKEVLEKYIQPEIILSTVDLILFKLMEVSEDGIRGQLSDVDRIIIDEASLLTESTFYCLARCFPKASIVLIGDDKQIPPFMYDEHVLGHKLAGQAALNVAMQRKNLPIIRLVEVYRAPQQLVQPYNNLSYDGTLVSRKNETCRPLFQAGLVRENRPDLLLIDIPKGHQMGAPSIYSEMEVEVLVRLLRHFPKSMHDDIMIICLYTAQKRKVQRQLGPEYEIMTVDSSQGKEKPIVIVLTTRTDETTTFFSNPNRCTVAVSRHQRALIILGNNHLLSSRLPWSKVLEDFTRIDSDKLPEPKLRSGQVMVPINQHQTPVSKWKTIPASILTDSVTHSPSVDYNFNTCEFPTLNDPVPTSEKTRVKKSPSRKNQWTNFKKSPVPNSEEQLARSLQSPTPTNPPPVSTPPTALEVDNRPRIGPTVNGTQNVLPPSLMSFQLPYVAYPPHLFNVPPNVALTRLFPYGVPPHSGWW